LFTFNRGVWSIRQKDLITRFGYVDKNGRLSLYSTVSYGQINPQGLLLTLDEDKKFLILSHSGGEELAKWKVSHLVTKFLSKMPRLLFALAESRELGSHEEFRYTKAYLCENPSDDKFVDSISDGSVFVDIRMHLKPNDAVRNHGTGFRVKEDKLYELYGIRKNLI
jgi:hypothetical protein